MRKDCPVCKEIGTAGLLESTGVIFTALDAYVKGDDQLIADIQQTVTPEDFHAALGLLTNVLTDMSILGLNVPKWIAANRKLINEQIAALGRETLGGESPNGPNGTGSS